MRVYFFHLFWNARIPIIKAQSYALSNILTDPNFTYYIKKNKVNRL